MLYFKRNLEQVKILTLDYRLRLLNIRAQQIHKINFWTTYPLVTTPRKKIHFSLIAVLTFIRFSFCP